MRALDSKPKKVSPEKAANVDAAMDSLARLLVGRERSEKEVSRRLTEKGYQETVVTEALERALACGLLDDQRFAQGFIKDKTAAGWGKRRIEQELYQFGIDTESVEGYPEAYFTEESQIESAQRSLSKHHSRSKDPRQAAYRYLINKGYSSDIAITAINLNGGLTDPAERGTTA